MWGTHLGYEFFTSGGQTKANHYISHTPLPQFGRGIKSITISLLFNLIKPEPYACINFN